jgi:protoporphyrinogen oxidase
VSQSLTSLIGGSDTIQAIEDSVDDLTSAIWQYNLQNLSGEVLGFSQKMNQLKAQETQIRLVQRQAEEFTTIRDRANEIGSRLTDVDAKSQEALKMISSASSAPTRS